MTEARGRISTDGLVPAKGELPDALREAIDVDVGGAAEEALIFQERRWECQVWVPDGNPVEFRGRAEATSGTDVEGSSLCSWAADGNAGAIMRGCSPRRDRDRFRLDFVVNAGGIHAHHVRPVVLHSPGGG